MSIVFITTLAQHVDNDEKYKEREKQYMYSLSRIFSYKLPVYAVLSETYNGEEFKPMKYFPFKQVVEIPSTRNTFGSLSKSQKEFYSLKTALNDISMPDDTWVIKVSGRYMIIDDSFMNTVTSASDSIKAIIRTCDDDTQMFTFLYALRFKYFKEFFIENDLSNNINLERVTFLNIINSFNKEEILMIDRLGIFCNVADTDIYHYF